MFCLLVVLPLYTLNAAPTRCCWLIGCFSNRPLSKFIFSCVVSPSCPAESSVLQSPVFTKQPGSIVYPVETLERNREVVFSCEAQGSPLPMYRWVFDCSISPIPPPSMLHAFIPPTVSRSYKFRQHINGKCFHLRLNNPSSRVSSSTNKSQLLGNLNTHKSCNIICYFQLDQ